MWLSDATLLHLSQVQKTLTHQSKEQVQQEQGKGKGKEEQGKGKEEQDKGKEEKGKGLHGLIHPHKESAKKHPIDPLTPFY